MSLLPPAGGAPAYERRSQATYAGRRCPLPRPGYNPNMSQFVEPRMAKSYYVCENASNHDPAAKVTQRIDFVRKDEILAGSFSRET